MDALSLLQSAALILAAFATSLAALVLMSRSGKPALPAVPDIAAPQLSSPDIAFLFDGDTLVDASPAAHRLLNVTPAQGTDIARLVAFLAPQFPDLHDAVMACKELDALDVISSDGASRLRVGVGGGKMRIRLEDTGRTQGAGPDRHTVHALTEALATYRALDTGLPIPVWRQSGEGRVIWANAAYLQLAGLAGTGTPPGHSLPRIFDLGGPLATDLQNAQRLWVEIPGAADPQWFDCSAEAVGGDYIFTALPAGRILRAERTLREFVQTLTQTFAHLSVGLAIFDRARRLTLFNPALTDLFGLPAEFLIARPSLMQFLDQLRERQMIPEPKDYKSWRRQMSALEAAAASGSHSDTWTLADGRTYRVTGRPHPDGAVAFLFEDITGEIALSRRFRSELETGQAVLDSLDEAIAVFSPAGYLILSNRSYAELWGFDPSGGLDEITVLDATRRWQQRCAPTPVWGDARDFAATFGERANWSAEVRLQDGRRLACRFEALPGGATLAAFSPPNRAALAPFAADQAAARA